jgi:hypothetical protein
VVPYWFPEDPSRPGLHRLPGITFNEGKMDWIRPGKHGFVYVKTGISTAKTHKRAFSGNQSLFWRLLSELRIEIMANRIAYCGFNSCAYITGHALEPMEYLNSGKRSPGNSKS